MIKIVPYKGFNEYKINEDGSCEFYIVNKAGEKFTVFVDRDDLDRLITLNKSWHIVKRNRLRYVTWECRYLGSDGKMRGRTVCLHRWIFGEPSGAIIDHQNFDTLDNRKENLRISTMKENNRNHIGPNKNNKCGYRNVCKIQGKWTVQLMVNGKNKRFAAFENLEDAVQLANTLREKYYGEFSGRG